MVNNYIQGHSCMLGDEVSAWCKVCRNPRRYGREWDQKWTEQQSLHPEGSEQQWLFTAAPAVSV